MKIRAGDVLPVKAVRVEVRNELVTGSVGYKAPKGEQFVLMLLGSEPTDGSRPLDPVLVLNALGWTAEPLSERSSK